jgi:hypothetical protein
MWLLKELWPAIAVAVLLVLVGLYLNSRDKAAAARATAALQSEYRKNLDYANARTAAAEKRIREANHQADMKWQGQVNELQNQNAELLSRRQPVRVCRESAPSGPEGARAGVAPAQPDAAAGGGGHGVQAGADIGDQLVQYATEAERYRRQLISLQGLVREVCL